MSQKPATDNFRAARDRLVALRENHTEAVAGFEWPDVGDTFNWGVDWFDAIARGNNRPALVIAEEDGTTARFSFEEMAARSDRVGNWLHGLGVRRGDAVMLMLGNQVELWDSMLAIMKLGAVILPTTTALGTADLIDRMQRGGVRHVIAASADVNKFDDVPGDFTRIQVGNGRNGAGSAEWIDFADAFAASPASLPHPQTAPHDPEQVLPRCFSHWCDTIHKVASAFHSDLDQPTWSRDADRPRASSSRRAGAPARPGSRATRAKASSRACSSSFASSTSRAAFNSGNPL